MEIRKMQLTGKGADAIMEAKEQLSRRKRAGSAPSKKGELP